MQEVKPKVVAIAVSTVMMMFRILLQRVLFSCSMMFVCFKLILYSNSLPLFEGTPPKTGGEPLVSKSN